MLIKLFKEKQSLINASRKALAEAEQKIVSRNEILKYQDNKLAKKDKEIRLLKNRIIDLENNIEFLVNNCNSDKIKELVTTTTSN